ncbi:MAG: adenylate/guanylate cyclase domain-containing protein [Pseudomonadota bacterium]
MRSFALTYLGWLFAVLLFQLIRYFGTPDTIAWADGPLMYAVITLVGTACLAGMDWIVNERIDRSRIRSKPYLTLIALKAGAMFVAVVLLVILVAVATADVEGELTAAAFAAACVEAFTDPRLISVVLYVLTVTVIMVFVRQMAGMVGPRILRELILGRYHRPKSEERIFMFLDLKGSTSHAEKLGHVRFTQLVQDCFRDLTDSVLRYDVEIYQYVGDEAILTWILERGLVNANCLRVFHDFDARLEARRSYYEATYGLRPQFKAGVNLGPVTVAEVGVVKRDIAYLSDVLNTAARIEGMCNEVGKPLLISASVRERLPRVDDFQIESIGAVELRGRAGHVEVFAVARIDP